MSSQLDRELNVRFIVGFGIVLIVVMVGMAALMWVTSNYLSDRLEAADPPPPRLPAARVQAPPPGPQLQAAPEDDLFELRAEEDEMLSTYEWVDSSGGIARVPISKAIEIMAATRESLAQDEEEAPVEAPLE